MDTTVNGRYIPGLRTIAKMVGQQEETKIEMPSYFGAAVANQQARRFTPDPLPDVDWDDQYSAVANRS
jgi:hypothetical protein